MAERNFQHPNPGTISSDVRADRVDHHRVRGVFLCVVLNVHRVFYLTTGDHRVRATTSHFEGGLAEGAAADDGGDGFLVRGRPAFLHATRYRCVLG